MLADFDPPLGQVENLTPRSLALAIEAVGPEP
jgi:hypothetical protein